MRARSLRSLGIAAVAALTLASCRDDGPTAPAASPTSPIVFVDNFGSTVDFQAFAGSKLDALSIDNVVKHAGSASLKFSVPAPGNPSGGYAGGAFVAGTPRNLTGYNALTFWAKASVPVSLNVAGLGNDNTGTSLYTAERNAIALTTTWTKYSIAIPLASKLSSEKGLFFLAEGAEGTVGYDLWFDDIKFENLTTVTNVRPALASATVNEEVGGTKTLSGTTVTVSVDGADQTVSAAPAYFTFASSTPSVATVNSSGIVSVLAAGSTNITATLGTTAATGAVALSATVPPAIAAPTPTRLAADVVSLFSNAYTNATIDTWSASWDQADVSDVTLGGNAAKKYSNLVFAGIEFTTNPVNASAMTHLHVDTWVNSTTAFKLKLVDFGANGVFGGGDDSEHEVTLNAASSPAITAGAWSSLDIPLSAFTGLTGRSKIAQIVLSGSSATTYLDNLYFYKVPVPPAPPAAATTPTTPAANVISLFSNAYTNRTVDTWSASWDDANVADTTIAGNAVKKITNFNFVGIEFGSNQIDASQMTHFRFDYWTPDATTSPENLKVKLVDFGANGAFGGGDDKEHELTFTAATTPGIATGSWVTFDIPLSSFTGLTTKANLAQLIMVSGPNTVYLDNIYFYASTALTAPIAAAPTPSYASGDVISLFSNAYTNRTIDTWSAGWDQADVTDLQVAGNDTKRYTNLTFAGIEFTTSQIDASAMTHFRLDYWSPDSLVGAAFKVKLVDFGANGAFGGGDDVEHELTFTSASTPALTKGSWVTIDIPLTQFTGLTTKGHLAQMILVGDGPINTVFIDNVLLHK